MIRKSGNRFFLATNATAFARDHAQGNGLIMMRFNLIAS
jgi:hypothetical protein